MLEHCGKNQASTKEETIVEQAGLKQAMKRFTQVGSGSPRQLVARLWQSNLFLSLKLNMHRFRCFVDSNHGLGHTLRVATDSDAETSACSIRIGYERQNMETHESTGIPGRETCPSTQ